MSIRRLYQINKVMLEHGLDELIPPHWLPWYVRLSRKSAFWLRNKHKDASPGERLRLSLQSLGPVFIKFGQMLSTRRDLLDPDVANELAKLQDKVSPFDGTQAKTLIERALDIKDISELFDDFDIQPLASASIAQVHTATLKQDQTDIVIKVIRPNIRQTIDADIELLRVLARLAHKFLPDGKRLRPVEVVEEYRRSLIDELNLLLEASNGLQLKRNFEDSDSLYVPHIYEQHCRQNVLVMERINAIPVSNIEELLAQKTNMPLLAERGVELFFTQVFRDSFFHADMHPGNIFVSREHPENPKYIGIDFGIVGTLNSEDKRYLAENFVAFFNRDYRKVATLHVDSGWVPADTNVDDFEVAIRTVCEPIFNKPLAEISFGIVLIQLFNTARRFNMQVQPQLVLLQKTLLYVEGLGRQLYPQLDLWKTAKPFLENWMQEQIGVKSMFRKVKNNLPYWMEKFPEVPELLYDSLRQLKQLPSQQQSQHQQLYNLHQRGIRSVIYAVIGGGLFTGAVLSSSFWLGGALGVVSALCWLRAIALMRSSRD